MPDPLRYETDLWPFVEARHFGKVMGRKVRVIVIHDMEAPELDKTAENVAQYFATTPTVASAHICVDNNSIVQCVRDSHVAYAAPGCNHDGIQVELAGYAKQTKAEWRDKYSIAMLAIASDAVAQYCLKYIIPAVHLTDQQLKDGARGIVGHDQVSRVYKKSTHTDPGPRFPWNRLILTTQAFIDERV